MLRSLFPLLFLSATLLAVEKAAPAASLPAPAGKDALSAYPTADALWAHVIELRDEPRVQPKSEEEKLAILKSWFGSQKAASDAFLQRFPNDPRRYSAQINSIQSVIQLSRLPGTPPATAEESAEMERQLQAIIAAPDASENVKGEAGFMRTLALADAAEAAKPETVRAFFAAAAQYLSQYGSHYLAPELRKTEMTVAMNSELPEAEAVLRKIAASPSPLAGIAEGNLAQRQAAKELRTKPVDLSFTAINGTTIDLAAYRGKVVLVDFWASWCALCLIEAPNIAATYANKKASGFEVIGISLDEDRKAMEAAIQKHHLAWPHYFDGKGWESPMARKYSIHALPASWLIDKKGYIQETNLRGDALGAAVDKLLAE